MRSSATRLAGVGRARLWLPALAGGLALLALADPARNVAWFIAVNTAAAHLPATFWSLLTVLGDTLVGLSLCLALLRARPDLVLAVLLAALPALLLTHGLKDLVAAPRPAARLGEAVQVIGPVLEAGAFPSGHTATAFVLATVLAAGLNAAWVGWMAMLAAMLIGLSRMAVGAHWPADIAAGLLCGWISAFIGMRLGEQLRGLSVARLVVVARLFLIACALTLLLDFDTGYPLARPFERGLALLVLVGHLLPGWRMDAPPP